MKQYLDLLKDVLENGTVKSDRTGTGTTSVFGRQLRFNLQDGFPLVTTKKVHVKAIIHELLWFLSGSTNIRDLQSSIWDEFAYEQYKRDYNQIAAPNAIKKGWAPHQMMTYERFIQIIRDEPHIIYDCKDNSSFKLGDLGPVYGSQWRSWPKYIEDKDNIDIYYSSIDQISQVINQLKNNPDSRRIIVSAWNVAEVDSMALPPCHAFFQFYTKEISQLDRMFLYEDIYGEPYAIEGKYPWHLLDEVNIPKRILDCQLYQRSADLFLGVPFNIASYALLIHMVAQQVNMVPGEFIHTFGDAHIYSNHMDQVKEQLTREPRPLPELIIHRKPESIFDYKYEDFSIADYNPYPAIKGEVAI